MITVRVRLYRSHDYDLMVLAKTKTISIASIAKKALEACFKGEDYEVEINDEPKPLPEKLGNSLITMVRILDKDCPGIENWYRGFESGARNNMLKCLIRKAIKTVPVWAYRTDGWVSAEQESKEIQALMDSMKENKRKSQVADKNADSSKEIEKKKKANKSKVSESTSINPVSFEKQEKEQKKKTEKLTTLTYNAAAVASSENQNIDDAELDDDEDFDAFAAFNALQL